ncbi:hypothetical protein [Parasitella parasitica]|uniref:Amino acid transporter transmembrane domain-containing protein n=1 Tax=Parasitella parasitica TaxID=35722 RepID=A0A0B7N424_9FUNG|nr:hypothetical protein [Parasitella parasitica]
MADKKSSTAPSSPVHIRVPLNTHPSHLQTPGANYGALLDDSNSSNFYFSAHGGSHQGSPSSFRGQLESFAGSYSRASALYMAENLSIATSNPGTRHGEDFLEEALVEEEQVKPKLLPLDHTLTHTLSLHGFPQLSRHTTVASMISQQFHANSTLTAVTVPQKSTFVQSVFNSVNVLVGIGVLALPLAFRCAGWLMGSAIFLFCSLSTNYTAKLIARCLDAWPNSATYGDMGAAAFGSDRVRAFVSVIFVVELMTIGVAMVVLLGDGIVSLFPSTDMISIRIASFIGLTPMLFLPIRKLAYTSLIGIISCTCLVTIVIYDGISKIEKPGSLLDPMTFQILQYTEIIPSEMYNIPLSFGLMMAGFAGHAVFPAIYRDMEDPKRYESMVDITYIITVGVYITMAIAGYMMFGLETMQEVITQNLASTPGYSKWVNRLAIWLIVLTPIAKYGLMMNPVSVTYELWITSYAEVETWCKYHDWRRHFITGFGRVMASSMVVLIATVFPGFDRVMVSVVGLFEAFYLHVVSSRCLVPFLALVFRPFSL